MLFILLLFILVESRTLFDGKWQLDQHHSVGSSDELMKLMGVDSIRRSMINSVDVMEIYEITATEFRMGRRTIYSFANTDAVYPLGVTVNEDDILLGKVKHVATYINNRLQETLERVDGAVFSGVKKIQRDDENKIIYTMNFTLPGNKGKASCVRYFLRR